MADTKLKRVPLETLDGGLHPLRMAACSLVRLLGGSAVNGRFPVNMAYRFTPLPEREQNNIGFILRITFHIIVITIVR